MHSQSQILKSPSSSLLGRLRRGNVLNRLLDKVRLSPNGFDFRIVRDGVVEPHCIGVLAPLRLIAEFREVVLQHRCHGDVRQRDAVTNEVRFGVENLLQDLDRPLGLLSVEHVGLIIVVKTVRSS